MTIKKLDSGFWHVRFGPNKFVQWPYGSAPTAANTFGFSTEDKEDAARRAEEAILRDITKAEGEEDLWLTDADVEEFLLKGEQHD